MGTVRSDYELALEKQYPLLSALEQFLKNDFPQKIAAKNSGVNPNTNCLSSYVSAVTEEKQVAACLAVIAGIKEKKFPDPVSDSSSESYKSNTQLVKDLKLPRCVVEKLPLCCSTRLADLSRYLENSMNKKHPAMSIKEVLETTPYEVYNLKDFYQALEDGCGRSIDQIKKLTDSAAEALSKELESQVSSKTDAPSPSYR